MPKIVLTENSKEFIIANRREMSGTDIAKTLGIDKGVVQRFLKKNGLTPPRETIIKWRSEKHHKPFTAEEDSFIITNIESMSIKSIAAELKRTSAYIGKRARKLGMGEIIDQKALFSRIKTGHVPKNKGLKQSEYMSQEAIERTIATRFKKGQEPHNSYDSNGVVTIRNDKNGTPHKYIRVGLGKWEPLHRHTWELHKGPIPKNMVVAFLDGDTMNCAIANLKLLSRSENMLRNSNTSGFNELPPEMQKLYLLKTKLKKAIKEVGNDK